MPGAARPGFLWTSKETIALDNDLLVEDILLGLDLPTKDDNRIFNLSCDQYLYMPKPRQDPEAHTEPFDAEPEGIGMFFRFGYTPEDRNPWNWFLSGGIGGRGVVPSRPYDRYGIGFYALFESDDLDGQPVIGAALDTEWGMEFFYNIAIHGAVLVLDREERGIERREPFVVGASHHGSVCISGARHQVAA
jgi:porin